MITNLETIALRESHYQSRLYGQKIFAWLIKLGSIEVHIFRVRNLGQIKFVYAKPNITRSLYYL